MTNGTDADFLQVLLGQVRKDPLVNLVVAEYRLVFFEAQAPQPDHDVHGRAQISGGAHHLVRKRPCPARCGLCAIRDAQRPPRSCGAAGSFQSSLYLPEPVYEVLRRIAFEERVKIHDLVMEGIDAVLRRRGHPSVERLKTGKKG